MLEQLFVAAQAFRMPRLRLFCEQ